MDFRIGVIVLLYELKTKMLISCTITTQLICPFVFAYAKTRFSHYVAHIHLDNIHTKYYTYQRKGHIVYVVL